jgi:hypothetical protein
MEHQASTALTTAGLAALRRAAVMAHTVGGITLRLSAGGAHLVEVRPDPAPSSPHRITDPCGFRMAVARAWADFEAGREIGLVGVGPTEELQIDWAVAAPGQDLGSGAVRVACGDCIVWAFASILDVCALTAVMVGLEDGGDDTVSRAVDGVSARLVRDDLLGATVVCIESNAIGATRALDEVLRRMVAVVGAAELLHAFA